MNRTPTLLAAALACVALGAIWTIPAAAAPAHGTLTGREYALLQGAEAKLQKAVSAKSVSWSGVRAVCQAVGSSTALMSSERASCLAETKLFEGLSNFPGQERSCGNAQPRKDICVVPLYTGLAKDAKTMYDADALTYLRAEQRGFTGRCLGALANTRKQLGEQRELATATEGITKDVELAAKVSEGKLPSGAITVAKVESDAKIFERDATVVLGQSSSKLSICPHT